MRLACPECSATYDVPEQALTAGRRLRCSACATSWEWTPPTPATEPALAAAPPPTPEPAPARAEIAPPRFGAALEERIAPPPPQEIGEGRGGAALAWVVSLIIIAAIVAGLYVWRAPVMHAWPPTIRLYAALGLT